MTFREKLKQEHPERITDKTVSGCMGCPSDYGYELDDDCSSPSCAYCWSREMPMTPEEQEKHDLKINAEILHGYCGVHPVCDDCPAIKACHYGEWDKPCYKLSTQLATLAAFKAALPVEEDMTYPVRRRIPESVRDLIDSRIISIDNQIKFLQAERQELVDFWNGKEMAK